MSAWWLLLIVPLSAVGGFVLAVLFVASIKPRLPWW